MKRITYLGVAFLLTGCCCTGPEVVGYQQVGVVRGHPVLAPVLAPGPVVQPAVLGVYYPGPIDVTTTTIDYY